MTEDATHPESTAAAAYADTRSQIGWQNHPARTDKLVEWLVQHPADCAILFNGKLDDLGPPSGKNKQEVNAAIAQSIFGHEEKYATHPDKYRDLVMSRINHLEKEWHVLYKKLHSTGAGVHPLDGDADPNLHAEIIREFPWFDDLNSVWGSNLSFAPLVVSSQPGVDHAAHFFSLVRSLSSERQTRAEMKNERAIAKLNVYRQEKEYQFIREERARQREDAAAAHQRSQDATDRAIKLREAEAKAHALEAEALQLKIRLHELSKE